MPVGRELPGDELAKRILPDRTLPMMFEGVRVPVPLPAMAGPLLRLVDGIRTVGEIEAALRLDAAAFARTWRSTYDALVGLNQLLLAAPA